MSTPDPSTPTPKPTSTPIPEPTPKPTSKPSTPYESVSWDREPPAVSVVVPAYNAAATLDLCLGSLLSQNETSLEVLVVDDGSTDESWAILQGWAERDPRVRPLTAGPRRQGAATARNVALEAARGEYLAFLDADMSAPERWLETLLAPLRNGTADVVGAHDFVPDQAPLVSRCLGYAMDNPLLTGGLRSGTTRLVRYLPGTGNLAFHRSLLESVEPFNPEFHDYGEDKEFLFRVQSSGARIRFVPEAWAWHHRPPDLLGHLRKQVLSGRRRVDIWRRLPGSFEWPHAAPAVGLVGFALGCAGPWLLPEPVGRWAQALVLGCLLAGTVWDGWQAWRRLGDVRAALVAPIASWGIPFGYGFGTLWRLVETWATSPPTADSDS